MNPLTGGLSELVRQADRKRETSHQYEADGPSRIDRKSTRLNSSHTVISYAVFCLKKKKPQARPHCRPGHQTRTELSAAPRRAAGGQARHRHLPRQRVAEPARSMAVEPRTAVVNR